MIPFFSAVIVQLLSHLKPAIKPHRYAAFVLNHNPFNELPHNECLHDDSLTHSKSIPPAGYRECRITTTDNPFDPFDDFEQWFLFDVTKGYNTCAYLGRIAHISDALSDAENAEAVEAAIDEIIRFDVMNVYKKVTRTVKG